jgi:hypothetical protein
MSIKKTFAIKYIIICFVVSIISSICHADEVLFPGSEYAGKGWKEAAKGREGKQLRFTSVEMQVTLEEIPRHVKKWDNVEDEENPYSYTVDLDSDAQIAVRCEGDSVGIKVYDYDSSASAPSITCPTGKGVEINFYAPHNASKNKCTYVADITAIEPSEKKEEKERVSEKQ